MTAELWLSLVVAGVKRRKHELDVVVIDEGHESVVLVNGEDSLAYQVDEASLVCDVVHGCVDGDDHLTQFVALSVQLWQQLLWEELNFW